MRRLFNIAASAIAIGVGLLMLIGLLAGRDEPRLDILTNAFLRLTVMIAAFAVLLGVLNLFLIHVVRIVRLRRGFIYSVALVTSLLAVIVLWLVDGDAANRALLESAQLSVESALAALLVFALVYGAYRMMRRRVTWGAVLFTIALLIVLIGALPLSEVGAVAQLRAWLLAVPVSAGARGLLLGIALATVVAGVRVLTGQDLSYRE
ncbi:MAG: hypothetical protein SGI73_18385 [Chloroflexota bacterium]|nr:hypothetical protein [Chloroflexota bacterium]